MKRKLWVIAWVVGLFCMCSAPLAAEEETTEQTTEEASAEESPKLDKKRQAALAGWVKKELVVAKKVSGWVKKAAKKPSEAEKMVDKLEKLAKPYMGMYGPGKKEDVEVTERKLTMDEIREAQKPYAKQRAIVLKSLEKHLDDYEDNAMRSYGNEDAAEFKSLVQLFINMMED